MKNKIITGVTVIVLLISAFFFSVYTAENDGKRYLQHKEARKYTPCETECAGLCTHLPIIQITTAEDIPGKLLSDENQGTIGYSVSSTGEFTVSGDLTVIDNRTKNNHMYDTSTLNSKIKIKVRGNSSRRFDKSNYAVTLVNEDGTNNPQEFLGMDAHHDWALHGPYLDKSLLRNYMWYNLSGEIMEYSPNVRFCELILNGEYKGLYLLTETIAAGKEGARLSLAVEKKDNTFEGYIIRLEKGFRVPVGDKDRYLDINPFTKYTLRTKMQQEIAYPGRSNITDEMKENIKDDFSYLEKVLYSYDIDDKDYGYKTLIDEDSFVDYFLINEIGCNYDAGWISTYMYKDIDGKYKMCVWDFNSACDNYQHGYMIDGEFQMQNCLWYVMLVKNIDFTDKVVQRYRELRKTYFSDEYLENFIDEAVEYLGPSIKRNYEVWGYTFAPEYDMLQGEGRNPRNYEQAISQIKTYFDRRLAWLDENIDVVRQYSAPSKVKKFNENAN